MNAADQVDFFLQRHLLQKAIDSALNLLTIRLWRLRRRHQGQRKHNQPARKISKSFCCQ
jgi:hypothetical protein